MNIQYLHGSLGYQYILGFKHEGQNLAASTEALFLGAIWLICQKMLLVTLRRLPKITFFGWWGLTRVSRILKHPKYEQVNGGTPWKSKSPILNLLNESFQRLWLWIINNSRGMIAIDRPDRPSPMVLSSMGVVIKLGCSLNETLGGNTSCVFQAPPDDPMWNLRCSNH